MGERAEGTERDVRIICFDGIESRYCDERPSALFSDTQRVLEHISKHLGEETPLVIVSSSFYGVGRLLRLVEDEGLNPYLLEFVSIAESVLSGLDLDQVIRYHYGLVRLTLDDRLAAVRVRPAVTRRELLRGLFLVKPRFVIHPRLKGVCSDACPYSAIRGEEVVEGKCRGCMYCVNRFECGEKPAWGSTEILAYIYSFAQENAVDALLITCRYHLDALMEHVTEASPAKTLLLQLPCIAWLDGRAAFRLQSRLDLPVYIFYEEGVCSECWSARAARQAIEWYKSLGLRVVSTLEDIARHAGLGYNREKLDPDEIVELLTGEEA